MRKKFPIDPIVQDDVLQLVKQTGSASGAGRMLCMPRSTIYSLLGGVAREGTYALAKARLEAYRATQAAGE